MAFAGGDRPRAKMSVVTFDELHHFKKWKMFLKVFFDSHWKQTKILVTGSAGLNVYKKGGTGGFRNRLRRATAFFFANGGVSGLNS